MDNSHHPLALKSCRAFQVLSKSDLVGSVSDGGDGSGGSDMNGESNAMRSTRDSRSSTGSLPLEEEFSC